MADKQTNMEFARDFSKHFKRWCSALEVIHFEDLCNLIVLEQYRDCISPEVATHIAGVWGETVHEAATLADILARKGKLGRSCVPDVQA